MMNMMGGTMPTMMGGTMPTMMPMMCRVQMEMTKEGMVCRMMPAEGQTMESMRERMDAMMKMAGSGMPVMMSCGGMPMMMGTMAQPGGAMMPAAAGAGMMK
ncbi:MAG TPA: hypothetical protein VFS43_25790 [Polyangiaceae bacterium]|nr:hypothetical protein [Polyangiaceae bacterium]